MSSYLSPFCVYIRVPEYVASYLRCTYHGQILSFSQYSPYYVEVSSNLIENVALSKSFSSLSYTQRAVEIAVKEKDDKLCEQFAVPMQSEMKNLVAVYIPQNIYRKCGVDQPSRNYQLTRRGAQRFRELARVEFWREFFAFKKKEEERHHGRNQKRAMVESFIREHRINMDCLETLYRHMSRNAERLKTPEEETVEASIES